MKKKTIVIIVAVVAVVAIIAGVFVSNYNSLVTGKENVTQAASTIDTYLQRRADLIPNLVSTVKNLAAHETEVFDKVLEARENLMGASTMQEKANADQELTNALQGARLVVENYPEIKSDKAYIGLMDQLEGSENRIATARKDYNDVVRAYNNKVIKFPGSLFAGMFGFEKAEYFEAQKGAENAPDVDSMFDK